MVIRRTFGWSPRAAKDVVLFRLVDTDGLTPLLTVLNDPAETAAVPAKPAKPAPGVGVPTKTAIAAPAPRKELPGPVK